MGLENIIKPIVLDVSASKYVAVILKQYDKNIREIIVTVTDNGKPYLIDTTITPRVKFKKNDNTFGMDDCEVLDNGSVKIDITEQMTAVSGISDYELVLFDTETDKILHTMNFIINVKKAVFSDEEISSTNEFKSLDNALLSVSKMEIAVDEMEDSVGEMKTIVTQVEKDVTKIEAIIESDELVHSDQLGIAGGVAILNENGFIPSSQLPSFVDDVLDGTYDEDNNQFLDLDGKPYTPESSKIYIDVNTRITYRWSGTVYVEIASSLALGETSETAFAGDRGLALEQLIGEGYREITEEEIDELFI